MCGGAYNSSVPGLTLRTGSFFAYKIRVSPHAYEIDQYADHVPCNYRSRGNQQAVVDPEDLECADDCRHSRIHACAGSTFEHRNQIGQDSEGSAQTCHKPEYLRTLKSGKEQARCITRNQFLTSDEHEDQSQEWNRKYSQEEAYSK